MKNERDVAFPVEGASAQGFLVLPDSAGPWPGLLVVHEWWGINDDIRDICRRFAAEGFAAMAVDLYGGKSTSDAAVAMQLSNDMKTEEAMKVVAAGAAYLRAQDGVGDKVGVTGFCLGGAMSIAAACTVPGLAAAVPFYGVPRAEFADVSAPRPPILGHYGQNDPIIDAGRVRALAESATAAGNRFEACFYDAGHAFMRKADPAVFHAPSAALAWQRTIAFLKKELAV
jgi:carboxymethylenebutenolidase